jgi:prepilin-type processing-associated H-X9-DG protein
MRASRHKLYQRPGYVPASGFTLVEAVIYLAVVVILLAILLPALASARLSSQRELCASNLRQIAPAWFSYLDEHGEFPTVPFQPGWEWGGVRFSAIDDRAFLDPDRPLNRHLPLRSIDVASEHLFCCPGDTGITGAAGESGLEVGTGRRTAYRSFGTSYRANDMLLDARRARLDTELRGLKRSEISATPSRLVILGDAVWHEALESTGRHADWHGGPNAGNLLFFDGSVRFMTIKPRSDGQPAVFEPNYGFQPKSYRPIGPLPE